MSFTCNFFVYFKFHSNLGRVIGKIKQNELDCRDTAPLIKVSFKVNKGNTFGDFGYLPLNRGCPLNTGFTVDKISLCYPKTHRYLLYGEVKL